MLGLRRGSMYVLRIKTVSDEEFKALKAGMPWREHVFQIPGKGGIVQILDKNNLEVPLFIIAKFLIMITNKLSQSAKGQAQ